MFESSSNPLVIKVTVKYSLRPIRLVKIKKKQCLSAGGMWEKVSLGVWWPCHHMGWHQGYSWPRPRKPALGCHGRRETAAEHWPSHAERMAQSYVRQRNSLRMIQLSGKTRSRVSNTIPFEKTKTKDLGMFKRPAEGPVGRNEV